jgi:hypothetical protein
MAKLQTIVMTEQHRTLLVGILEILRANMIESGRLDLAMPVNELLTLLQPFPVTPLEA